VRPSDFDRSQINNFVVVSDTETWEVWTKQPGDDGWLKVAFAKRVLPWTASLLVILVAAVPALMLIVGTDVPTRVRYAVALLYVVGLFALATASDRAVQLERRRRRENKA